MGHVSVTIAGRSYTVACDDGEEEHLTNLAQYLDGHVSKLAQAVGQVGDARLLLMAGLLVADELSEALSRTDSLEADLAGARDALEKLQSELDETRKSAAEKVNAAAERVETIAGRLEGS